MYIQLNNLSFAYATPLIEGLSCRFETGWSAIVGTNGAGKTTLLQLITGRLQPDGGSVQVVGDYIYCTQIAEELPVEAEDLFDDYCAEAFEIKLRYGISEDWRYRWETLSFGEQKRIQVATAIYLSPDILILDEPTNHLDTESREILIEALKSFGGVGIVVSHDRRLLDDLTRQTLFLEPSYHEVRNLPYTEAKKARDMESSHRAEQREILQKEVRKLKQQASAYRNLANSADKRNSKKTLHRKDSDSRLKMDTARILGKDAMHGKMLNQLQGRISHEERRLEGIRTDRKQRFNFSLHFTPGRKRHLFHAAGTTLQMGDKRITFETLRIGNEEKIALVGKNGSGKSTLLRYLYPYCLKETTLYIPQELDPVTIERFFLRIGELNSREQGEIYSIMAALGSDPERVLLAQNPSPGEIRKLMIAQAILKKQELLILDEPTNHLDLHSIEALGEALSAYRAALLLVSHDQYFLSQTTDIRWEIHETEEDSYILRT